MGGMTRNYGKINTLVADVITGTSITNSGSTSTTSITIVTGMTSTLTSQVLFTKQTIYVSGGIIQNFSTVTSTEVVLD